MKSLLLLPATLVTLAYAHNLSTGGSQTGSVPSTPRAEHEWVIDGGHSSVVFRVKHANAAWFHGTFDKIEGHVHIDPSKPEAGSVKITIPVDSVDTNDGKRDGHLKAPDFFNSKENPSIVFTSTKIEKKSDALLHVTGTLAMAGKEQSITIPVEKTGAGDFYGPREGWMTTFTIKRSDYGMTYGIAKNALGDEVTLMIALETVKPPK